MADILTLILPFLGAAGIEKLIARTGAKLATRLIPVFILAIAALFCVYWFTGIGEESVEAVMANREFVEWLSRPMLSALSGFVFILRETVSRIRKGCGILMLLGAVAYCYLEWTHPELINLPVSGPVKFGIYAVYVIVMLILL